MLSDNRTPVDKLKWDFDGSALRSTKVIFWHSLQESEENNRNFHSKYLTLLPKFEPGTSKPDGLTID
jgi:hypothetical protein